MKKATYLGDGVYIHENSAQQVVLTSGHHDPEAADNRIYLEPGVIEQLKDWLTKTGRLKQARTTLVAASPDVG